VVARGSADAMDGFARAIFARSTHIAVGAPRFAQVTDFAARHVSTMNRQLHLNLFIHSRGHHEASWRHKGSSPLALTDIRYYQDLARRAEHALFDSIFLADQLALGEDAAQAAGAWLEPVTVLAAAAVATSRIGMIATASTTYSEPFNLARQFGSLDHISNGRVAWNIVTSWLATAAGNFGGAGN
jgi:alkanesulfonate monooxygenase SsuD/methylene tetrahydromethanopterin reductase-like flavin-dependent oxidoreductase (luciferase family)